MTESLDVQFDIEYSNGEICGICGQKIEELKLVNMILPARRKPFPTHVECIEQLGWRINYFTFHYEVDQTIHSGVN